MLYHCYFLSIRIAKQGRILDPVTNTLNYLFKIKVIIYFVYLYTTTIAIWEVVKQLASGKIRLNKLLNRLQRSGTSKIQKYIPLHHCHYY